MGFSRRQTASIIIILSGLFSSVAIAGSLLRIPEYYLFFFFMAYFTAYFTASFHIKKMIRNRAKLSIPFITARFQQKNGGQ